MVDLRVTNIYKTGLDCISLKIIGQKVPKLKEISTQMIVEKEITQPKTGKGLLQEPINKYFQSTSTQSNGKDETDQITDAIKGFDEEMNKGRDTAINEIIQETIEEVIRDKSLDPGPRDKTTSTEDLYQETKECEKERLQRNANKTKDTLEKEAEKEIIATLSKDVAIKDQTIIGLNEQLIRMEKTLRDYEKRMTLAGLNIKESDAVFTTTKCVMGDRIMIRLDEIEKQMQTLTGKKLREDSKNFKKEQKTAKNL